MTSIDFESLASAFIAGAIANEYDEQYGPEQFHMVWFAHVLGNKKAIFIDTNNRENHRIYEVTYNAATEEIYVDIYVKASNHRIPLKPVKGDQE